MKKILILVSAILLTVSINGQSLDEIVKKNREAIKADKLETIKTIKITGTVSAMGMELPLVTFMKSPNKVKVVYSFNGQDMIQLFDGEKGYMVNPMTGSADPVEITGEQLEQIKKNNAFKNELADYLKDGKLTLEGDEAVDGKPAFKIKAMAGATPVTYWIDKESYLVTKSSATVEQMGQTMTIESYLSDYVDTDGVMMPHKTTQKANGMEISVITFSKVEVNTPIEDSVFKIK